MRPDLFGLPQKEIDRITGKLPRKLTKPPKKQNFNNDVDVPLPLGELTHYIKPVAYCDSCGHEWDDLSDSQAYWIKNNPCVLCGSEGVRVVETWE